MRSGWTTCIPIRYSWQPESANKSRSAGEHEPQIVLKPEAVCVCVVVSIVGSPHFPSPIAHPCHLNLNLEKSKCQIITIMQSSMLTLMGFLALLFARGDAQALYIRASPSIYNGSYTYQYYGCYNETTDIDGSDHERALANGINEVKKGQMTVPMCLSFCSSGNDTYRYAGLEWSR